MRFCIIIKGAVTKERLRNMVVDCTGGHIKLFYVFVICSLPNAATICCLNLAGTFVFSRVALKTHISKCI